MSLIKKIMKLPAGNGGLLSNLLFYCFKDLSGLSVLGIPRQSYFGATFGLGLISMLKMTASQAGICL